MPVLTKGMGVMKLSEHLKLLDSGEISSRVIEHAGISGATLYCAWFPDWEGPARHDYAAAHADMIDRHGAEELLLMVV